MQVLYSSDSVLIKAMPYVIQGISGDVPFRPLRERLPYLTDMEFFLVYRAAMQDIENMSTPETLPS